MSTPYVGEIRLVGFTFAPPGWLPCDGRIISIAENETLFTLIGTTYGGDGVQTFGLPDLRGRVPVHQGQGNGGSVYIIGQTGGSASVTLTANQIAQHTHLVQCQNGAATTMNPSGAYFATSADKAYLPTPGSSYSPMTSTVGTAGGSASHDNMQPYLAILYMISTVGIFPSQS